MKVPARGGGWLYWGGGLPQPWHYHPPRSTPPPSQKKRDERSLSLHKLILCFSTVVTLNWWWGKWKFLLLSLSWVKWAHNNQVYIVCRFCILIQMNCNISFLHTCREENINKELTRYLEICYQPMQDIPECRIGSWWCIGIHHYQGIVPILQLK